MVVVACRQRKYPLRLAFQAREGVEMVVVEMVVVEMVVVQMVVVEMVVVEMVVVEMVVVVCQQRKYPLH
jgi:hypothetical protein